MFAAREILEHRCDSRNAGQHEVQLRQVSSESQANRESIKCLRCASIITYFDAAISPGACHTGWYTNPSGYTFYLGCFDCAPGCKAIGPETQEHSWFPGYGWSYALCAVCGAHLGWRFRSRVDQFYALILDRLVRN